ncbi:MAG TPA: translocation/assembly module TamB domain-containing protein, partial [Lacunisphaera sp.]|nr:translocation/assembly module TamB domain-containing protein [Lacunisphaera sp.]
MSRGLKFFLLMLLAFGVLLAAAPWWLGVALRPILRSQDITFKSYERNGYARFTLHEATYARGRFRAGAARVNAPTPLLWVWQRSFGSAPLLRAEQWHFTRDDAPVAAGSKPGKIRGLPDLKTALDRIIPRVTHWLPLAELTDGELRGLGPRMTIAHANWKKSVLTVDGFEIAGRRLDGVLALDDASSFTLTARSPDDAARASLDWRGAQVNGEAGWWNQPVTLVARFPAEGWLPDEANVAAKGWNLPAARVSLGAPYAQVRGDAHLLWRNDSFEASLEAEALPVPDTKNVPPFAVRAAAHGTLRELTLTALDVNAPFATARLSAPVSFRVDRPPTGAPARLTLQADLAKLPWIEARGQVAGNVTVTRDTAATRQEFALNFRDVSVGGFMVRAAEAQGTFAWPKLEVTKLVAQLDQGSSFEARGAVDWRARELLDVRFTGTLASASLTRWLPPDTTWERAEISASIAGPFARPSHRGSLRAPAVRLPRLRPAALEATWAGEAARAEFSARATAEDSALALTGVLARDSLQLTKLELRPDGGEGLALVAPARLTWLPGWALTPLELRGPNGRLLARGGGGPSAHFAVEVAHFPSAWLQDWVAIAGPAWRMIAWQASGQLEDTAWRFETTAHAQIKMSPGEADVRVRARGDERGTELQELTVAADGRTLTQATGRLPLAWVADPKTRLLINDDAPLELAAGTEPDSPLWATLAGATGIALTNPSARASLHGTLRQPAGEVRLTVARAAFASQAGNFSLPELTDVDLGLEFAREAVTAHALTAKIDGQAVHASGRLVMTDERWRQLWRTPQAFDWRAAEGRVEIPDADLAPLARRFPGFAAAQGRLHARLDLAGAGRITGELQLKDAASRPHPPFGTLKEINADLAFADRTITVRSLSATLGGEPLRLEGSVALDAYGRPKLALALQGKNLPLVRSTGLLVRTDVDLRADSTEAGVARLSGTINVRDCLLLANVNLRNLLPSGRRDISRNPPYFSVAAEPFNRWPLAVTLRAANTVRLRTTVYNGVASASFQLGGTLGEPRAVGEVTMDEGQVLFPFATFTVQQGTVRLRESDPYHAVVSLNAVSQRRNHQLRLEMTGELPAPNVVLSSTPAMEPADVLLMVMTGQPPPGDTVASTAAGPRLAMLGAYLGRGLFQDLGFGGEDRLEITAGERVSRDG